MRRDVCLCRRRGLRLRAIWFDRTNTRAQGWERVSEQEAGCAVSERGKLTGWWLRWLQVSDLLMFVCFYFRNVGLLAWLAFMDQSPQSLVAMDLGVCARERACPVADSMEA